MWISCSRYNNYSPSLSESDHACSYFPGDVTLSTTPNSGQFTTGSQVHITCSYSLQYTFDSFVHPVYGSLQTHNEDYRIQNNNNVATLELLEPKPIDSGTYFCTFDAASGDGGRAHAFTTLIFVLSVSFVNQVTRYVQLPLMLVHSLIQHLPF